MNTLANVGATSNYLWQPSIVSIYFCPHQKSTTCATAHIHINVQFMAIYNLFTSSRRPRYTSEIPKLHTGLNVLARIEKLTCQFHHSGLKSQKRDFRHFSGAKVCCSHGNVKFENFMHMEWSEEKFLKGIVGDKTRLRF